MKRTSWWAAWLAVFVLLAVAAPAALAAPSAQNETPTVTPSPTPDIFIPSRTPTATLLPLPKGGGRVAIEAVVVRLGPSMDWARLGGLPYGEEVHPIGRSIDAIWVVIPWNSGLGWILADVIEWDPSLDLQALPVYLLPSDGT